MSDPPLLHRYVVAPIYRIPVEVLLLIAGQLGDIKDLNAFSRSCKGFHNHIAHYRAYSSSWCNEVDRQASGGLCRRGLHGAISALNNKFFILLVWRGADLNERNDDRHTVLHRVAAGAFWGLFLPTIVSTLIKYGADPDAKDADGMTPLHHACFWSPEGSVDALLAHPDTKRNKKCTILGWTPLHYAVYNLSGQAIHALLADPTVGLDISDDTGGTALHIMYQINPTANPKTREAMDMAPGVYQYSLPQNQALYWKANLHLPQNRALHWKAISEIILKHHRAPAVVMNSTDRLGLTPYQYILPQNRALHWKAYGAAIRDIVFKQNFLIHVHIPYSGCN